MNEFEKLTTEEVIKRINDNKEELLKLRMKQATGTLENPARINELRKDVNYGKIAIKIERLLLTSEKKPSLN